MSLVADVSAATNSMLTVVHPIAITLGILAGLVSVGFLINGGIQMMTSSGKPDKLEHAKKIIRNSIIGLVVVLAAVTLTSILTNTYHSSGTPTTSEVPALAPIQPASSSGSLVDVLVGAVTGLPQTIIESAAQPFISALSYFTTSTPLMSGNSSVFNLWLIILAIADVLFVLVVILLGFHIMSASSLGFDEIEFKHMIPQLILIFVLMNSSIFMIDGFIQLSNGMITALRAGFGTSDVWDSLKQVASSSKDMKLATLLIFIVFIVLSVILPIYYILRLVIRYIGAVLAPLVLLIWLIPSFKDFAVNALRTYLTTVFVLFIHVVILALAAAIIFVFSYTYSINGVVTDISTMQPVEGVVVSVAGYHSTTGVDGKYNINEIKLYEKDSLKIISPRAYMGHDNITVKYTSLSMSRNFTLEPSLDTTVGINFKAQENLQYDYMWNFMHPASQAYWGDQKNYTDTMKNIFTYYQSQNQITHGYKIDGTIRQLKSRDDPITGKTYENVYEVPVSYTSVTNGQSTPMTLLDYYQEVNGSFRYFTGTDKNKAKATVDTINTLQSYGG